MYRPHVGSVHRTPPAATMGAHCLRMRTWLPAYPRWAVVPLPLWGTAGPLL